MNTNTAIFIGIALMNGLQEEAIGFAPAITLIPAINALLAGTIVQMAIAYDNDAVAMHILTGVTGAADRAGRLPPSWSAPRQASVSRSP